VSAIRPQPAARRVSGHSRPAAPSSSNAPLTSTAARGHGNHGGTIRISVSVSAKCAMPPIRNQTKTNVRPARLPWLMLGDGMDGMKRV
jgi:hypothetical protein